MESVNLQMEDIFGPEEDDPFSAHTSIPDLPPDSAFPDEHTDQQNIENDAVLARLRDLSRGAATKTVKRIQPKLDPARLTGDRGIGTLPKVFKDVRFQGKGHEAEDLKKIMRYLEHWTHRLFPKMPFDEVLQRIEKLGTKKEVQTYIKRMRMDIPLENDENAIAESEEILDDSIDNTGEASRVTNIGAEEEEVLDEIMREEDRRSSQSQSTSQSTPGATLTANEPTSSTATPTTTTSGGLTVEQVERMEANKRRAHERRMAKLGHKTPGTPLNTRSLDVTTPLAYPTTPATDQSVTPLHQASSASPLVGTSMGDNSPHKTPRLELQVDPDQLTEDQLLAGLEDGEINNAESTSTQITSNSDSTETSPPNASLEVAPTVNQPVAMDTEETLPPDGGAP